MQINHLLKLARTKLVWIILPLSVAALSAEILPEVKAKIIVIPTLILIITFCIMEIRRFIFASGEG